MTPEEEHREYTREMKERFLKSLDYVDKYTVLISSGGLALSLTFIEKLGGAESPYIGFLIISWVAFALTLMGTLFSHWFSSRFHESTFVEYNNLQNIDLENRDLLGEQYAKFVEKTGRYNKRIGRFNNFTLATLCAGVTFLILFATLNTLIPKAMAKERVSRPHPTSPKYPEPDTKGLPLPTPPRMPLAPQTPPPAPTTPKK